MRRVQILHRFAERNLVVMRFRTTEMLEISYFTATTRRWVIGTCAAFRAPTSWSSLHFGKRGGPRLEHLLQMDGGCLICWVYDQLSVALLRRYLLHLDSDATFHCEGCQWQPVSWMLSGGRQLLKQRSWLGVRLQDQAAWTPSRTSTCLLGIAAFPVPPATFACVPSSAASSCWMLCGRAFAGDDETGLCLWAAF